MDYTPLFELLRAGLHPDYTPRLPLALSETEWRELSRTAARQSVAAMVWDAVPEEMRSAMPRPVRIEWALRTQQTEENYRRQLHLLSRLAEFYARHGIPLTVLKGYGLSLLYPVPQHRPCSDIDIWLGGRQEEADRLLRCEKGVAIDNDKHHHTTFVIDGVLVENHYDFLNVHAYSSNRMIERRLHELVRQPGDAVTVGGHTVRIPSPDFHALFLLRHAAGHFASVDIVLRHAADWAMLVERNHARIDWEALYAVARETNMHRFLNCLNAIAIDRLGVAADKFPSFQRDAATERRVTGEILSPEFTGRQPAGNIFRIVGFKTRRWWANRWKHRLVYREGLLRTFIQSSWSHLLKPRSIKSR